MKIIKISPRGYCYGVVDALTIVLQAANNVLLPRPIYILGQIIHNRHTTDELTALGVITLDGLDRTSMLEQVQAGTVIFTAHGVSPAVKQRAQERGLHCIDATCPDVGVTHRLVRELVVRIEDLSQLQNEWLEGKECVAVTAGASTPSQITRAVIHYLEHYPGQKVE